MTDLPGQPIDIPLPPDAVAAFGYAGKARFVSFRWVYDDLVIDDGRMSQTGAGWVFSAYSQHRAVFPLLTAMTPEEGEPAQVALLIDREKNRASLVPAVEARSFLHDQWPPEPPLSPEQQAELQRRIEEMVSQGWREIQVDPQEVMRLMQEQRGRVGRMMSWLDMAPEPPSGKGPPSP